jgi:hypothetical protein
MQNISSLITSKTGLVSIVTGISFILTVVAPVIPAPWGALITAILGIFAFYHIGNTVSAARVQGVKGI